MPAAAFRRHRSGHKSLLHNIRSLIFYAVLQWCVSCLYTSCPKSGVVYRPFNTVRLGMLGCLCALWGLFFALIAPRSAPHLTCSNIYCGFCFHFSEGYILLIFGKPLFEYLPCLLGLPYSRIEFVHTDKLFYGRGLLPCKAGWGLPFYF